MSATCLRPRQTIATLWCGLALVLFTALPTLAAPLTVGVTIPPQQQMVERVAGSLAKVEVLVPPGKEPHFYEPTPKQMQALAGASVYFATGMPWEEQWLPRIAGATPQLEIVQLDEGIEKIDMPAHSHHHGEHGEHEHDHGHKHEEHAHKHDDHGHGEAKHDEHDHKHEEHGHDDHGHEHEGHDHGKAKHDEHAHKHEEHGHDDHGHKHEGHDHGKAKHDEHAHKHEEHGHDDHGHKHERELDPHLWTSPRLVMQWVERMAEVLAEKDPNHASVYRANAAAYIEEINALDAELTAIFGDKGGTFMVYHPAWGYFARDYGLTQQPIEVEGKSPSPKSLKGILFAARELGVKVIFVQPQYSQKAAETIARELGAQVVSVDPLAPDWLGNMRAVAAAFKAALQ